MVFILFIIGLVVIAKDLFISGSTVSFIEQKVSIKQIIRLIVTLVFIPVVILISGIFLGKVLLAIYTKLSFWYAATILFILSLKLMYSGLRLHKIRLSINPTDKKGLIAISAVISINTLFFALAFGLLNISYTNIILGVAVFFFLLVLGFILGTKMKKLISIKTDLLAAVIFLFMAIVVSIKL